MNDALYFRVRADGQWLTPRDFERACERFESRFLKTAMPLYVHHADHGHLRLLPIGTGFLFAVAERRFLVTARHVIDGFVENDQLVLTNNITGDRFTTRAPRMFRPTGKAVDFALLPLDDKDVEHLTGMEYVGLGSLALTDQSDPNVFRLIGYPQDLAKDAPQYRTALHVSAHLAQVPVPAALGLFEPDHHLLLELSDENVRNEEGEPATVPHLASVSGGPLWRITHTNGDALDLVDLEGLRLAGIESSVYPLEDGRQLVKAVSSGSLVQMLSHMGDDVLAALKATPLAPAEAR